MQALVRQGSCNKDSEAQSARTNVWTEEDLPVEAPAEYHIPAGDYQRYRTHLIGQDVEPADLSHEQLQEAGFASWTQYHLHCSLGNF